MAKQDKGLDTLLDLDGTEYYMDDLVVKIVAKRTEISTARPHGIRYSLTLHRRTTGQRMLGFDNAHAIKHRGKNTYTRRSKAHDHTHSNPRDRGELYIYQDGYKLLADFFKAVEDFMKRR